METKRCVGCNTYYPLFFFHKTEKGAYTRDGRRYCCKLCSLKNDTRYTRTKKEGAMFATLNPSKVSWWYRVKEFLSVGRLL